MVSDLGARGLATVSSDIGGVWRSWPSWVRGSPDSCYPGADDFHSGADRFSTKVGIRLGLGLGSQRTKKRLELMVVMVNCSFPSSDDGCVVSLCLFRSSLAIDGATDCQ